MSSIGWTDASDEDITHLFYVVVDGCSANAYVVRHFKSADKLILMYQSEYLYSVFTQLFTQLFSHSFSQS